LVVLPPGLEPRMADPKSAVISISPQEHAQIIANIFKIVTNGNTSLILTKN